MTFNSAQIVKIDDCTFEYFSGEIFRIMSALAKHAFAEHPVLIL
jgi:hypothetical protein